MRKKREEIVKEEKKELRLGNFWLFSSMNSEIQSDHVFIQSNE